MEKDLIIDNGICSRCGNECKTLRINLQTQWCLYCIITTFGFSKDDAIAMIEYIPDPPE